MLIVLLFAPTVITPVREAFVPSERNAAGFQRRAVEKLLLYRGDCSGDQRAGGRPDRGQEDVEKAGRQGKIKKPPCDTG